MGIILVVGRKWTCCWGYINTDKTSFFTNDNGVKPFWFQDLTRPHELSHARSIFDVYPLTDATDCMEVLDDNGDFIYNTPYLPEFGWGCVDRTMWDGEMNGNYLQRYDNFSAAQFNAMALQRSPYGNQNWDHGTVPWLLTGYPSTMRIKLLHLNNLPWTNATIVIYTRIGERPGNYDNIPDYTLKTDASGFATLPAGIFNATVLKIMLKIYSPDNTLREYRFIDDATFKVAYWNGITGTYDHVIRTEFDLPPVATFVDGITPYTYTAGDQVTLTFNGTDFKPNGFIRFNNEAIKPTMTYYSPSKVGVTFTIPVDFYPSSVDFIMYNPDGKQVRIIDPYQMGIDVLPNTKPYAHFEAYDISGKMSHGYYFNGLWSHDWGNLLQNEVRVEK